MSNLISFKVSTLIAYTNNNVSSNTISSTVTCNTLSSSYSNKHSLFDLWHNSLGHSHSKIVSFVLKNLNHPHGVTTNEHFCIAY